MNLLADAVRQLREGGAVLKEPVLQLKGAEVGLRLVVVLHLRNLVLGDHLEVLVIGLRHTEVANLVGHLVGEFHDGGVGEEVLALVHQVLVGDVGRIVQFLRQSQFLQLVKEASSEDGL